MKPSRTPLLNDCTPLSATILSIRTLKLLEKVNIVTVGDFFNATDRVLELIPGSGPSLMEEFHKAKLEFVAARGTSLSSFQLWSRLDTLYQSLASDLARDAKKAVLDEIDRLKKILYGSPKQPARGRVRGNK